MSRKIITPPLVECPDSMRCGQAVILMILNHFIPEKNWTYEEADQICYYKDGIHTWDTAPIKGMIERGFEVVHFCRFDPDKYLANPTGYLSEYYDQKTVDYMLKYGGIDESIQIENELKNVEHYVHFKEDWQWNNVAKLLAEGYLILTWVNARKLYSSNKPNENVSGHFVLLFDYDEKFQYVMLHDGGSIFPTDEEHISFQCNLLKNFRIGSNHFMNAAKSDKTDGGNFLAAFRLRKS